MANRSRSVALYLPASLGVAYLVTVAVHGWYNALIPCLPPWAIAGVYAAVARRVGWAWLMLFALLAFFAYPHVFGHRLPWA